MIRVYSLPVETIEGIETVAGIDIIHDALLECTENPDTRRLIMNTTDLEHQSLLTFPCHWREPTDAELVLYHSLVVISQDSPDTIRAQELLAASPDVITMPEIWELLRIFGRRLGYRF